MPLVPAVFVHGVPERAGIWDPVRSRLGRDDHIAVSLPGFEAPVPDSFGCTMDEYAGWLTAGIAALAAEAGPVDLVGHDWGGILAIRVASTRPDLLRSWCSDAAGIFDDAGRWHAIAEVWQTDGAGEDFMAGMEKASQPDREATAVALGVPAEHARLCSLGDPVMDAAILRLYRSAGDIPGAWGPTVDAATGAPGMVLHGAADPFLSERLCARVAARTGAQHDVLPGLGHWWCLEGPEAAAKRLERFWSEAADGHG